MRSAIMMCFARLNPAVGKRGTGHSIALVSRRVKPYHVLQAECFGAQTQCTKRESLHVLGVQVPCVTRKSHTYPSRDQSSLEAAYVSIWHPFLLLYDEQRPICGSKMHTHSNYGKRWLRETTRSTEYSTVHTHICINVAC